MSNLCIHNITNNCDLADDGKHQGRGEREKQVLKLILIIILIVYDCIDLAKKDSPIEKENLEAITEVIVHN